ncbi:MAG: 1-acyl-sn-glycerol-3-phosphate acyltransferase [Desulfobacterales bacterium]|nr:1-acyl-sn-glycerol-3-phosphate acyltransferase [Desulfobacterales bacterium]
MQTCCKYFKFIADVTVTIVLWTYFTIGFVLFFSPFYAAALFFSKDRRIAFQKINHRFFKVFLWLLRAIVPGLTIEVDERIPGLRSCVVVSNHRSYLDPVIFIGSLEKQTTIVKSDFFRVPVLGRVIKTAGYIPSEASSDLSSLMVERIDWMPEYMAGGGVVFVFPEGTRNRGKGLNPFNIGAFKIARRCNAPIEVVCITNTERLFAPGRFLFNTCVENRIDVRWIGSIVPNDSGHFPVGRLMEESRQMMEKYLESRANSN